MAGFFTMRGNGADAVTGERITNNELAFDTGIKNKRTAFIGATKTRILKEATIVWLAEQAGYVVTKRDAGDSGDAASVDESDVSAGGGEASVGEAKVGGGKTSKRRSSGAVKGK